MLRRIVPVTAAAALLVTGLAGCSAQQSASSDCVAPLAPGALSNSVTVLGGFGEPTTVSIPQDIEITKTQRTIAQHSNDEGAVVEHQTLVGVNMMFFDAANGKQLYASPAFSDDAQSPEFLIVDDAQTDALTGSVKCAVAGDRIVVAMSPEESALYAQSIGGTAGSSIVGVVDVVSAAPLRAEGAVRGLPSGFPAVVTNEEGRPGMVLPPVKAPAGLTSAVRIAGDGDEVADTDNVIGQVLSVSWDGRVERNTWEEAPTVLGTVADIEQSGNTYRSELTGAKVGSQVVIMENEGGSARVVVVDILGVN